MMAVPGRVARLIVAAAILLPAVMDTGKASLRRLLLSTQLRQPTTRAELPNQRFAYVWSNSQKLVCTKI